MGILTGNLTFDLIAISAAVLVVLFSYFKWKLTYWERRGIPSLPASLPFGNAKDLLLGKQTFGEQFWNYYQEIKKRGFKHGGVYFGVSPTYVPVDPDLCKQIMQVDYQNFASHGGYINEENDPLTGHLFNLVGGRWKAMRTKLTPTFTSGKMKMMFQTLVDCSVGLKDIMDTTAKNQVPVDIKDILGRFTTDIIGSVAFGLECNSLKDPESEFRKYGKRTFENDHVDRLKGILRLMLPHKFLDLIKFSLVKKEVESFFMKVIEDTVSYREKNQVYRKDFMHLLLQLKNRGLVADDEKITGDDVRVNETLTLKELAAQAFVFFLAGFETSSTTMTFALYELATNPEIQAKLRSEIREVLEKHDNKVTYDAIMEMTYMDKVINETLRKHPPLPLLPRECTQDYKVPGTSAVIEKGTNVMIPVLGLHTDPEYYPEPQKFDPERFTEENKAKRPAYTWLPFGDGPRVCIGLRFGLMQSKVGLATLLQNYKISLNNKTILPLEMEKASFITTAKGGIWLNVEALH